MAATDSTPENQNSETQIERLMADKERITTLLKAATDIPEQTRLQSQLSVVSSDILCAHIRQNSEMMRSLSLHGQQLTALDAAVNINTHDIAILNDEKKSSDHTISVLNGRVKQLENRLEEALETINDLSARSMRNNLVIKSKGVLYKEQQGETYQQTCLTFKNFLRDEMGVADAHKIVLKRAHRMGFAHAEGYNRPMIANILLQSDLDKIMSKVGNLKNKAHSVNIQVPPAYNERRQHAWSSFKTAKGGGREAKLHPNGDLYVDKQLIKSLQAAKIPNSSMNLYEQSHSFCTGQSDSVGNNAHQFRARSVAITSLQGVRDSLDLFCAEPDVMTHAKSVCYAYRIRTPNGLIDNFNSRGDTGVGPQILKELREKDLENIVCLVAHHYKDKAAEPRSKAQFIKTAVLDSVTALVAAVEDMNGHDE